MNDIPTYKWLLNKKTRDWSRKYQLLVKFTVAEIGMEKPTEKAFRRKVEGTKKKLSRIELWNLGYSLNFKLMNELKRAKILRKNIDNLEERDAAVRRSRQRSRRAIQLARKKIRKKTDGTHERDLT